PGRRPGHTRAEGMTSVLADPQIPAHLHRPADATGIPYDALTAWASQPAPASNDPALSGQAARNPHLNGAAWNPPPHAALPRAAVRNRSLDGTAWNPAQLEALRRQVAATRAAATAAEAA